MMKKQYIPPRLEVVLFRLSEDILGRSTESDVPVIIETQPSSEPSEIDWDGFS